VCTLAARLAQRAGEDMAATKDKAQAVGSLQLSMADPGFL